MEFGGGLCVVAILGEGREGLALATEARASGVDELCLCPHSLHSYRDVYVASELSAVRPIALPRRDADPHKPPLYSG